MNTNKIISYLLIAYAFIFPLSTAGANVVLAILLLFWVIEGNFKQKFSYLFKDGVFISILGIIILMFISTLLSRSYNEGFLINGGLKNEFQLIFKNIFWPFVLYIVFSTSIRSKQVLNNAITAFLIAMFINELISYSVYFGILKDHLLHELIKKGLIYYKMGPNYPSPMFHIYYSIYLACAIILLIEQFLERKNIIFRIWALLFLTSATVNIFINGGRTGQLALIIGIIVYSLYKFRKNYKLIFSTFIILITVLILAYSFSPIFKKRINLAKENLVYVIKKHNYCTSWGERIAMNIIGFSYIFHSSKSFIFGGFAGEAKKNYLEYGKKHFPKLIQCVKKQSHLHNQFLQIWMDGGIVAFLLILYLFYYLITLKTEKEALKYAIITIFLFSFFSDVIIYRPKTAFLFYFLIGIITSYKEKK